ncbi:hypothetical protein ACIBBE_24610 [Streptomyces sp. NPDC051644]|uniref:hypothetical protein n=1 Tax=Streptomyces sp. NPDC051644 TaxID=3365666 RepID=UPI0037A8ECA7
MRSKLLLTLAIGLLLAAFPDLGMVVFGIVCSAISAVIVVIALIKAHLTLVCCIAAVALLARAYPAAFPRAGRWLARAVVDSVASVMPQKSDNA